jgi:hypothetical protein
MLAFVDVLGDKRVHAGVTGVVRLAFWMRIVVVSFAADCFLFFHFPTSEIVEDQLDLERFLVWNDDRGNDVARGCPMLDEFAHTLNPEAPVGEQHHLSHSFSVLIGHFKVVVATDVGDMPLLGSGQAALIVPKGDIHR